MEHNYLYWLSRRIGLEMCSHSPSGREMSEFAYLNTFLCALNRYGALPFTHYSKDDVFTLEGDLNYRYVAELLPEEDEIRRHFPTSDAKFWENVLVDAMRMKDVDPGLNGLDEDLLRKACYMRIHIPYVGETLKEDCVFSVDDLKKLDGKQLMSVISVVEAYDMVFECYGLNIEFPKEAASDSEFGTAYIKDKGERYYLPIWGNAYNFTDREPERETQEYEL